MKFLLNNREFDRNIPSKNWDWKIVSEEEMRELLDGWEFGVFGNGYANVGVSVLREEHGMPYPVSVRYTKSGWQVRDTQGNVFLREDV